MKISRLFTGADGHSHLEELPLSLQVASEIEQQLSVPVQGTVLFNESKPGHQYELHNAPRRQFVLTLQGEIEVEASGQRQRFGAGTVLIAEDLTGTGHRTKVTSSVPWRCAYIPF